MVDKIVMVDFGGTLILPFVPEESNVKRYEILHLDIPTDEEHKKMHATKSHYEVVKDAIEKECGIKNDMEFLYTQNKGKQIELSGEEIKTTIMTDLFKFCMYKVVNEHKDKIFEPTFIEALKEIKKRGYKLAIVSGMRSDIITGVLNISGCDVEFDYIYGQDPVLSRDDNNIQIEELQQHGQISFIIGDKSDDFDPAKKVGAKTIFVSWGHPRGGEEEIADFVIKEGKELLNIIK